MKVVVVGCGSIGKRHLRNLLALRAGEIIVFDTDERRRVEAGSVSRAVMVTGSMEEVWKEKPDCAVIATPTSAHLRIAREAAEHGCDLFIEKPLADTLTGVPALARMAAAKRLVTMVGCNMRFYWAVSRIKSLLDTGVVGRVLSARMEFGQYLPDWHPGEDYRKMYSARTGQGGGVLLDCIHELDYALWFFGPVAGFSAAYGKLSGLEIETEDVAEVVMRFKNGPLTVIHLDYFQRCYSRQCKIVGERGTISWDFNEHAVKLFSADQKRWKLFKEPRNYVTNDMYISELRYYLQCVVNRRQTCNPVACAARTLGLVLKIKESGHRIHIP